MNNKDTFMRNIASFPYAQYGMQNYALISLVAQKMRNVAPTKKTVELETIV